MKQKTRILIYIIIAIAVVIMGTLTILKNHQADSPATAQEHINLGRIYLNELSYEKAVLEFTEAIEIEPLNPDAYLGLAETYVGMGDTEKAAQVLENGYEKTGDERLKAMLEKLTLLASEGAVTTIASDTETAISAAEEEQENNEMIDLYIPYKFSQYYSNGTEYMLSNVSIFYDNYYISYSSNENNIIKTENTISGLCDYVHFFTTNYCPAQTTYYSPCQKGKYIVNVDDYNFLSCFNDSYGYYCIYDSNYDTNHINISRNLPACIYDEENNLLTLTESEYNDDNQEIERRVYDKNGELEYKYKYEYDTNKRLIKEYYNENLSYEYKYDENGNLINILDYYEYNGITKATYTYDKYGNLMKSEELQKRMLLGKSNLIDTTEAIEYKYNDNGNLIEKNVRYQNDAAKYLDYGNVYDEYGNCFKWYDYLGFDGGGNSYRLEQPNERYYSYVYDNEGNIISTKTWNNFYSNNYSESHTYQYENGKIIKDVEEHSSTYGTNIHIYLYHYNSDGNISKIEKESSFVEYTYDSHGNIIKEQEYNYDGKILSSNEIEYIRMAVPKHIVDEMEEQYNIKLNH